MTKIKLKFPIEIDGTKYNELTMRRSKVKDRLTVASMKDAIDEEKEIRLFANLCNITPEAIKELDETDYINVQKVYMVFLDLGATSGGK